MKKQARPTAKPTGNWPVEAYSGRETRSAFADYAPMALGGVMLVLAFAFAGHYMGQNAIAHNADPTEMMDSIAGQSSNILAKGSLVPQSSTLEVINKTSFSAELSYEAQAVAEGKGDRALAVQASVIEKQPVQIIPASVNLTEEADGAQLAPSPAKVVQGVRLKRSVLASAKPVDKATQKAISMRRIQMAEENCLARAVYFEARSESELGQLAVAKVILNRVKDPEYPKSICGVVYQGSGRRNSCQFSFACDGLPDDVRSAASWSHAKRIAKMAMSGDASVAAIGSATNYHADYVRPAWAKSMKRLIKIGRHVFYEDS